MKILKLAVPFLFLVQHDTLQSVLFWVYSILFIMVTISLLFAKEHVLNALEKKEVTNYHSLYEYILPLAIFIYTDNIFLSVILCINVFIIANRLREHFEINDINQ